MPESKGTYTKAADRIRANPIQAKRIKPKLAKAKRVKPKPIKPKTSQWVKTPSHHPSTFWPQT